MNRSSFKRPFAVAGLAALPLIAAAQKSKR